MELRQLRLVAAAEGVGAAGERVTPGGGGGREHGQEGAWGRLKTEEGGQGGVERKAGEGGAAGAAEVAALKGDEGLQAWAAAACDAL